MTIRGSQQRLMGRSEEKLTVLEVSRGSMRCHSKAHIPPSTRAWKPSVYLTHEDGGWGVVSNAELPSCHTHQSCLEASQKHRKLGCIPQVSGFISVAVVTHPRGTVHPSRGVTAAGGRNSWSPHTHKSREKWMHTHSVLS